MSTRWSANISGSVPWGDSQPLKISVLQFNKVKWRATHWLLARPPKYMKCGTSTEGRALRWLKCLAEEYQVENRERESPAGGACALNVNFRLNNKQSFSDLSYEAVKMDNTLDNKKSVPECFLSLPKRFITFFSIVIYL